MEGGDRRENLGCTPLESIVFTNYTFQGTACEYFHLKTICRGVDANGSESEKKLTFSLYQKSR